MKRKMEKIKRVMKKERKMKRKME